MIDDKPAGFWIRLVASILDGLFLTLVIGLIAFVIYGQFFLEGFTILDVFEFFYHLLLPVFWYGYTVGKKAMGIRIARVDGDKVGVGTMLLRNVVAVIVYAITLGIGLIVSAFMVGLREDKRSLHDFIAWTYVTYHPPEISNPYY